MRIKTKQYQDNKLLHFVFVSFFLLFSMSHILSQSFGGKRSMYNHQFNFTVKDNHTNYILPQVKSQYVDKKTWAKIQSLLKKNKKRTYKKERQIDRKKETKHSFRFARLLIVQLQKVFGMNSDPEKKLHKIYFFWQYPRIFLYLFSNLGCLTIAFEHGCISMFFQIIQFILNSSIKYARIHSLL